MKHRQWKKEFEDSREPSLGKAEDMHLVHYSPQAGLKYIDPKFSGTGVDSRTKGRETEHPHSFYYRHGTEPEEVVTGRAANKYHVKVGADKPVYDIGQDPKGLVRQAIEENQGIANMDIVHGKLKEHGFHGFHNSSHPSLSNVVAMYHPQPVHNGEMEKAEELKKGSLQARTPFKPTSLAPEDKKTVGKWQTSVSNEGETERAKHREVIPRMEGNARARALHKLSGQTKTRMTPEGKREFLMHRGMSTKEKNGVVDENIGTANHENSHSSWTPDFSRANNFAWGSNSAGGPGHVVSAWTHEDNVHFIPSQFGATIEEGHPEQGKNRWRGEQEVIVKPNHNSKLHSVSPYKERLDENPKDIHNAINARAKERTPKIWPSTSPEEAAKLKAAFDVPNPQRLKSQISSRFGKSESLEKALKSGDDPVDRSKKFPHPSGHAHFNVRTTAPSKGTGGKQEYEVHHTETASAEKPYPQPTWHDTYPSLKDAHRAIKEKQAKPCPCDKCNMEKSEIQPLLKPWSSQAQAAWGHSPEGKAALGGEAAVKEWDAATKGKHLPKHVKKSEDLEKGALKNAAVAGAMLLGSHAHAASGHLHQFVSGLNNLPGVKAESTFTPNKKGKQDGQGQYRIKVGNYTINGQHHSMGGINNHHTSMEGPKNPTPKDKEDENKAQFLRHKLTTTGQALLDKSEDLEKGALKNLLTAGAMGAALASASPSEAHAPSHEPLHPQSGAHPTTGYDRNKVLNAISQVESSGGKNTAHKPTSMGTAYGRVGLMPDVIHDTIRLNPDLKRQHKKALNLQGDDLHRYMQDNPKLEDQIANKHLSRLEHHFGKNPEAIAFSWNHGILGTNRELKAKHDISSHPYVQKFKHAYEGKE